VNLLSEAELISALQRGDGAAYERLVRQYSPRMLAVAKRFLASEAEAQDCVQEAFLSAFKALGRFEERASLGTWLHRITVNAALAKLRKRPAQPEESIDDLLPRFSESGARLDPAAPLPPSVEQLVTQQEVRERVAQKIRELPELYRTVLLLRDVEGFDTREVAAAMNASEEAVKTRLHRARAALKKLLEPLWKELRQ
jgi:RNA polymerase sigma-70 factor (ECF subfamily)